MAQFEGTIEEVVFRNASNGWTVLSLKMGKERVSAVGVLPEIIAGERALIQGDWIEHPDYGMQIRIDSCQIKPPDSRKGMERFLASGYIRGVGPATAKLILSAFGKDAFRVLEEQPERLKEIAGIGSKKAAQIAESFAAQREMRQTMVFLETYGISGQLAARIYKTYGADAPQIVRTQPYRLVEEVEGVGFLTADAVARSLGVSPDDPGRMRAGICYALEEAVASGGHCYLPYEMLLSEASRLLKADSEAADIAACALILDGQLFRRKTDREDCVYLPRLYEAEGEVAQRLATMAFRTPRPVPDADSRVSAYERSSGVTLSDEQRKAVLATASGSLAIVTGGPGTGKTTCIRCMLEALGNVGKTELCAPTGRAAKRMSEAAGREAKTIHRLLEYGGEEDTFLKNELDPIDADLLIVDEMSMCDLFLMRALLRAIRIGARVVLVGDADQLPSVGAGNVLADLIASDVFPVIRLNRIFRQGDGSRIVDNAHRINAGQMPIWNGAGSDFFFERRETGTDAADAVVKLVADRLPKYLRVNPMNAIQVMAPMKKGDAGVWNLNKRLQQELNPRGNGKAEFARGDAVFREGDRVMQVRNNYQKEWTMGAVSGTGVFNGDIGFIDSIDSEERRITVCFDENRLAEYGDEDSGDLELAYCMSVHKSQGGEFDAIVLPLVSGPPMLMTRNLLYTAVTRAKRLAVLVGREQCVSAMVRNDHIARRYSALAERLSDLKRLSAGV